MTWFEGPISSGEDSLFIMQNSRKLSLADMTYLKHYQKLARERVMQQVSLKKQTGTEECLVKNVDEGDILEANVNREQPKHSGPL